MSNLPIKEKPILFSGAMVRALLDGSKTQTRRVMKPQPEPDEGKPGKHRWPADTFQMMVDVEDELQFYTGMAGDCCPYGSEGEHIWVRETFYAYGRWETRYSEKKKRDEWHFIDMTLERGCTYQYAADNPYVLLANNRVPGWYKRPAIFMPRAVSRMQLEIINVRVERLNDISEADAQAEGFHGPMTGTDLGGINQVGRLPSECFQLLWESLNCAASWAKNPWVWVVKFKRIDL